VTVDNLVANARGAIRNIWSDWKDKGAVSFIEIPFEEVTIDKFEIQVFYT